MFEMAGDINYCLISILSYGHFIVGLIPVGDSRDVTCWPICWHGQPPTHFGTGTEKEAEQDLCGSRSPTQVWVGKRIWMEVQIQPSQASG